MPRISRQAVYHCDDDLRARQQACMMHNGSAASGSRARSPPPSSSKHGALADQSMASSSSISCHACSIQSSALLLFTTCSPLLTPNSQLSVTHILSGRGRWRRPRRLVTPYAKSSPPCQAIFSLQKNLDFLL